jgi:hypothetical protein
VLVTTPVQDQVESVDKVVAVVVGLLAVQVVVRQPAVAVAPVPGI